MKLQTIFIILIFGIYLLTACGNNDSPNKVVIVEDDNPPVDGGFLEIASNPDANASQKHLVSILKEMVEEEDNQLAYEKLLLLKELDLFNKGIKDIQALSDLTQLESLRLNFNYIKDPSPLTELVNLTLLYLSSNDVQDLNVLSNLVNLESLWLINNTNIGEISPISNLIKLEVLGLQTNIEEDITDLENLVNLKHLEIEGEKIKVINAVSNFTKLTRFWLIKTLVEDLTPMEDLINLEQALFRDNSNLRNFQPLDNLEDKHLNDAGENIFLNVEKI